MVFVVSCIPRSAARHNGTEDKQHLNDEEPPVPSATKTKGTKPMDVERRSSVTNSGSFLGFERRPQDLTLSGSVRKRFWTQTLHPRAQSPKWSAADGALSEPDHSASTVLPDAAFPVPVHVPNATEKRAHGSVSRSPDTERRAEILLWR